MQARATRPAAVARAPADFCAGARSRNAADRARKSGTARTSRLSHERRQLRAARQARSFRPRCSVLRARPAPPARRNGTGRTGGPPRSEAPSHATSRMTSDVNAKSVHSDRSDTLRSGAGHGSGAATPAAAAASSAAAIGRTPPQRQEPDRGPDADVGKAGHAARPVAVERCRASRRRSDRRSCRPASRPREGGRGTACTSPSPPAPRRSAARRTGTPSCSSGSRCSGRRRSGRRPVRASRRMARAGQCRSQGASRQWLQASERWKTGRAG